MKGLSALPNTLFAKGTAPSLPESPSTIAPAPLLNASRENSFSAFPAIFPANSKSFS